MKYSQIVKLLVFILILQLSFCLLKKNINKNHDVNPNYATTGNFRSENTLNSERTFSNKNDYSRELKYQSGGSNNSASVSGKNIQDSRYYDVTSSERNMKNPEIVYSLRTMKKDLQYPNTPGQQEKVFADIDVQKSNSNIDPKYYYSESKRNQSGNVKDLNGQKTESIVSPTSNPQSELNKNTSQPSSNLVEADEKENIEVEAEAVSEHIGSKYVDEKIKTSFKPVEADSVDKKIVEAATNNGTKRKTPETNTQINNLTTKNIKKELVIPSQNEGVDLKIEEKPTENKKDQAQKLANKKTVEVMNGVLLKKDEKAEIKKEQAQNPAPLNSSEIKTENQLKDVNKEEKKVETIIVASPKTDDKKVDQYQGTVLNKDDMKAKKGMANESKSNVLSMLEKNSQNKEQVAVSKEKNDSINNKVETKLNDNTIKEESMIPNGDREKNIPKQRKAENEDNKAESINILGHTKDADIVNNQKQNGAPTKDITGVNNGAIQAEIKKEGKVEDLPKIQPTKENDKNIVPNISQNMNVEKKVEKDSKNNPATLDTQVQNKSSKQKNEIKGSDDSFRTSNNSDENSSLKKLNTQGLKVERVRIVPMRQILNKETENSDNV